MNPSVDYRSEYCALRNAIHRCHSDNNSQFKDYGGRGIVVCEEWRAADGFQKFIKHIGPKPSSDLTLDRIDNDGNYEPGNVRWATRSKQVANRRRKYLITIGQESKTISEWSKSTGIHPATLHSRIKQGLIGQAILTPQPMGPKK